MDPAVEERIRAMEARFQEQEQKAQMQERQAADSDVDANCARMAKKFPDVPEHFAITVLEQILAQKRQDDPKAKLTPEDWDKAWKSVDDKLGEVSKARYSKLVNGQKTANQKGRDVASGGGIPGQAPRAPKTIKEATDQVLQDLQNA
jgi:hypothetical protein